MSEVRIFESATGKIQVILDEETVWLSLNQLSELFERDKSVISRHLRRIFAEKELSRDSVVAKNATTASDGKTYQVEYFNLDAIQNGEPVINDIGLSALTLLVAESDPKHKETLIRLIMNMLAPEAE